MAAMMMMDTFRRRHKAPAEAEGHRREARDHEPYPLQRHTRLLHEAELPLEARQVVVEEHHFEKKKVSKRWIGLATSKTSTGGRD